MSENIISRILKPGVRGRIWRTFFVIIIITFGLLLVDAGSYYNKSVDYLSGKYGINLPKTNVLIPFRLGLDLQGGTHLVYRADMSLVPSSDVGSALEGVRDVIERRVNVFGVSEPVVQTNVSGGEHRIIVELAGITDVNEAIKQIGETPLLEFKEQDTEARVLTDEEKLKMDTFNKEAKTKIDEAFSKLKEGNDFIETSKNYSTDEDTKVAEGSLGYITSSDNQSVISLVDGLNTGEYTDVIDSGSSFDIYKLEDKREKTNPFNDNEVEKEIKASHLLLCYDGIDGCENGLTKDEAYAKIKEIKNEATPTNFASLVKKYTTEPGGADRAGELGWFSKGMMVGPFEDTVFPQKVGTISYVVETKFGYHLIYKEDERPINEYKISDIKVNKKTAQDIIGPQAGWKNTELTGKNLKRAVVTFNHNDNSPEVSLEFDSEGTDLFANITERNIGKPVAIFLDSYPISVPTVNERIPSGRAVISGSFNVKEAKLLAQRLNAGALPVPIELISQQTVGPSLGKISLMDSLKAGLAGLLLVAIFMMIYYRLSGILAVLSLALYGILILAIFKIWPVTLTLSGMAGFILSIGMAVDANVLIFERLKEELKKGNPYSIALDEAFKRAWPSIRDGNVSTLITCFILIQFSTSVVKGFAITLGLGVTMSMLTAVVVTKNFSKLFDVEFFSKRAWLFGGKLTNKK